MKKIKPICVLLAALCAAATFAGEAPPAQEPANPGLNQKGREILAFFQQLEARDDRRLLSGQFVNFGSGANLRLMEDIHEKTGHWPAILGVDYADFRRGSLTCAAPNRAAMAYWKQGGLVTISAHLYNPANPMGGGLRDQGVDLDTLLATNSESHARWMGELDLLAGGLQELKNAGVVVLWRPFHEMNGGWFWWGGKDPKTFVKLWRQMFDYFTRVKRLDNLLWVYAPNHGTNAADYYPGDRYVDLVGLDAYTDFVDTNHIHGYDAVSRLPKPFGFTEFGPHAPSDPPGDYDYLRLLAGIKKYFPRTVFFMSWNANWSLARNENTKALLNQSWLVNREELPEKIRGGAK